LCWLLSRKGLVKKLKKFIEYGVMFLLSFLIMGICVFLMSLVVLKLILLPANQL
jgi:hypothetical protein